MCSNAGLRPTSLLFVSWTSPEITHTHTHTQTDNTVMCCVNGGCRNYHCDSMPVKSGLSAVKKPIMLKRLESRIVASAAQLKNPVKSTLNWAEIILDAQSKLCTWPRRAVPDETAAVASDLFYRAVRMRSCWATKLNWVTGCDSL